MKRVVFVIPSLHAGGAERVAVAIANHLDRERFHPQVICFVPGPRGGLEDRIPVFYLLSESEAAEVGGGFLRKLWRRVRYVHRLFHQLSAIPDDAAVIGFLEPTAEYLWLVRILTGRRYLVSLHSVESHFIRAMHGEGARRAIEAWLLRRACLSSERVLVPSRGCKDDLVQHFKLPPQLIDVIVDPGDVENIERRCHGEPERQWPSLDGRSLFVHVARLEQSKNHRLLIAACRLLRDRGERFMVLCLGSGSMEGAIRRWIDEGDLARNVLLIGHVTNPYPFISRARALVLTSHFEGFALVLVEAMACGSVAISVNCPCGPAEILENGKCGLLVASDDAEALATAMARVIHDDHLYRTLRERGFDRARHFAVSTVAQQWSRVLMHDQNVRLVSPPMPDDSGLPRITVVTPTYNRPEYLEDTIRSVVEQNYPKLEYVIVDGGSSDRHVLEIIRKYQDKLAWWVSEPDGGHAEAIRKGFDRATGDVLAWLCSDDTYLPGALNAVGDAFRAHSEADIVYGHYNSIDSQGRIVRNGRVVKYSRLQMLANGNVHQASVFWSRKIYQRAGGQVGGLNLEYNKYSPDSDLYYRMIAAGARWTMVPRTLSTFRLHDNHTTSLESREVWNHYWRAARRHYPFWTKSGVYRAVAAAMRVRRTFYLIKQGDARYLCARLIRRPLPE